MCGLSLPVLIYAIFFLVPYGIDRLRAWFHEVRFYSIPEELQARGDTWVDYIGASCFMLLAASAFVDSFVKRKFDRLLLRGRIPAENVDVERERIRDELGERAEYDTKPSRFFDRLLSMREREYSLFGDNELSQLAERLGLDDIEPLPQLLLLLKLNSKMKQAF